MTARKMTSARLTALLDEFAADRAAAAALVETVLARSSPGSRAWFWGLRER
jgi:hypothetical protein